MRFAADQYDIAPVLFCIMLDMIHDTSIVEMNGDDLLVDDVLREEGQFLGLSADVVPDLVIEGADRRGCAERLGAGLAGGFPRLDQIGRASCRERVWQYVLFSVVDVSLKKKNKKQQIV